MSDSLADLMATDAELDRIARREGDSGRDLVLAELSLLAAAVDDVALPPTFTYSDRPAMTGARKGGWALSVTVALMVTSSGVAAAVSEDPLGPLHYVTTQMWRLGPHTDGGKLPGWQLDGAMPISTVPGIGRPGVGSGTSAGIPGASAPAHDVAAGSPDAREVSHSGSPSGGQSGAEVGTGTGAGNGPGGPGSGPGSRPPWSTSGSGPQGVNSRPHPPAGGHHPLGNVGGTGSGPTKPGDPGRPHEPGVPGHRNEPSGNPDYGRVPGSGAGQCRVDRPDLPGSTSWSGSRSTLHPCGSQPSGPATSTGPDLSGDPQPAPTTPPATGSAPTRATPKSASPVRSLP